MTSQRTTVDVWEIWLNYGDGWECEAIEKSRPDMITNRNAYREAGYSPLIRKAASPSRQARQPRPKVSTLITTRLHFSMLQEGLKQ